MKVQSLSTLQSSNTTARLPKIAYFILVHRLPQQFKKLFEAIYDTDNIYLIHLDKKAGAETNNEVRSFLAGYANVHILERSNVAWGGYSMVQAELNGMKHLLSINADWDFFINLSGQDFPLRTQDEIRTFLSKHRDSSFIKIANQAEERPDTLNRIENYFTETNLSLSNALHKRAYMKGVTAYIGGQWMILNRECCEFICYSDEVKRFEDYYANTLIPDESFFQTVLMNTSFSGMLINNDKRSIIWIPDGSIKLRPKTFTLADLPFLLATDDLFARKFDSEHDISIINALQLKRLSKMPREATALKLQTTIDSVN